MVFLLCVTAFIGYALFDASSIPDYSRDRVFPMFVASVCLLGCAVMIVRMILAPETDTIFADSERSAEAEQARYSLWSTLAWFAALLLATALVGFIIALAVFLFSFMRIRANMSALFAAVYTFAGVAFICAMAWALNRDFPPGLLQAYADLPWPFT
jgi:ABC-type sugar transport system permease subunit